MKQLNSICDTCERSYPRHMYQKALDRIGSKVRSVGFHQVEIPVDNVVEEEPLWHIRNHLEDMQDNEIAQQRNQF